MNRTGINNGGLQVTATVPLLRYRDRVHPGPITVPLHQDSRINKLRDEAEQNPNGKDPKGATVLTLGVRMSSITDGQNGGGGEPAVPFLLSVR